VKRNLKNLEVFGAQPVTVLFASEKRRERGPRLPGGSSMSPSLLLTSLHLWFACSVRSSPLFAASYCSSILSGVLSERARVRAGED
jgi:hypothetical protein